MKTFLSVIDSYDEIIDFIFPANLSFFMSWCLGDISFTVKRPSLGAVRFHLLEKMVGTNGKLKLVQIQDCYP